MNESKHILSYVRRAVDDYEMINDGDKIAVGVSGGKDSLTLLYALANLRRFYPKKFDLIALTVDMGFDGMDFSKVEKFIADLDVPYHTINTQISKVIFDVRKEENPCSLCARMRRGAIHSGAKELGCNKIAFGHHFDDVANTFIMNLFFEGRVGCFSPVTYLSRTDITLIRPLIYTPEKDIKYFASKIDLPVVKSTCPADGNTERAEIDSLISDLDRRHKGLKYRIFGAIQRGNIDGFKECGRMKGINAYSEIDE